MKYYLKSLRLTNFKGIRSYKADFDQVTNICGHNGTGKTTLMDGFMWLLFGKDSLDRKDFEIKTLDDNNKPYHELSHEVEGVMIAGMEEITLRREFREKWVTKRGTTIPEFKGHETSYFWNDVPMKQEEYQQKIAGLMNENIFKLITNTTYFNSLKWQDRRAVLMQIAGVISDDDIFSSLSGPADKYAELRKAIDQKKSVEEFRSQIRAKMKKLKDELQLMPSKIEEATRALPELKDYVAIEENIALVTTDMQTVEGLLMNKSEGAKLHQEKITAMLTETQGLIRSMSEIENRIKNEVSGKAVERQNNIALQRNELSRLNNEIITMRTDFNRASERKNVLVKEQNELREKWNTIDAEKLEFKPGQFDCPACKRAFESSDIESRKLTLTNNFNADKAKRLEQITNRGKEIGTEIGDLDVKLSNLKTKGEKLAADIATITARITELETQHTNLVATEQEEILKAIESDAQRSSMKAKVTELTEKMKEPYAGEDNSALLQRKNDLSGQLIRLKTDLSQKEFREKQLQRIDELKSQESTMAQELATLEGTEFSIDEYIKAKMDILESRINGRFKLVRFKMFEEQINGGQVEACTTLIKGVPYDNANRAAQIQAGLDIINTLSDHYGVTAPVWVDNRESVINLPETSAQLINLIVSEGHDKLTIVRSKEMAEAV